MNTTGGNRTNCRNFLNRLILILGLFWLHSSRAEPVARPAESWEEYDLIAKVVVRSVDASQEVKTYDTAEAQMFAHPVEVEVVAPLRMPGTGVTWTVLAPGYGIYRGKRLDVYYWTNGVYSTTNVLALACRFARDKATLAVDWVLTDEEWETYRRQKETGAVERPPSQADHEIQQRLDAANKLEVPRYFQWLSMAGEGSFPATK